MCSTIERRWIRENERRTLIVISFLEDKKIGANRIFLTCWYVSVSKQRKKRATEREKRSDGDKKLEIKYMKGVSAIEDPNREKRAAIWRLQPEEREGKEQKTKKKGGEKTPKEKKYNCRVCDNATIATGNVSQASDVIRGKVAITWNFSLHSLMTIFFFFLFIYYYWKRYIF